VDREGRTIFVADAHRDDGKRFVVRAEDKFNAFLELERAIQALFFAKQSRGCRVEILGSKLRALSGAERRLLDTVLIHNAAPS
jgi:hypothetical protein